MKKVLSKFPPYILSRFENIPDPEKKNVLEQANLFGAEVINPDEEMIEAFDEVLRYKEAKISLVRLMLEGMIEDDINDRLEAKELASDLLNKYCLSEVIKVYEEKYRAEAN
jgi:phytoene/squalene synthetase